MLATTISAVEACTLDLKVICAGVIAATSFSRLLSAIQNYMSFKYPQIGKEWQSCTRTLHQHSEISNQGFGIGLRRRR